MLLQGNVQKLESFDGTVHRLKAEPAAGPRPGDRRPGSPPQCRGQGLLRRFEALIEELGRKQTVPPPLKDSARELIAELRPSSPRPASRHLSRTWSSWTSSSASGTCWTERGPGR